jgi:hypothetical protein
VEHHVTLPQFGCIVSRLLRLHKEGVPLERVTDLSCRPASHGRQNNTHLRGFGDDDGPGSEGWTEDAAEAEAKHTAEADQGAYAGAPLSRADAALGEARSTRMSQRRAGSAGPAGRPADAAEERRYRQGLQAVESKIAPIVQYDRRRHKQLAAQRDRQALKTVAQRRVDALASTAGPLGFRDRHYFSEPHLFHSKPTARSADLASAALHKTGPAASHSHAGYRRYADLGSGLATMEIADAFLQGEVGREILSTSESDYRSFADEDSRTDPAAAQRKAEQLLGLADRRAQGDARFAPNAQYPIYGTADSHNNSMSARAASHTAPGALGGRLHVAPASGDHSMRIGDFAAPVSVQSSHRLSASAGARPLHQDTAAQGGLDGSYGHRTVQDKRVEARLDDAAKRQYEVAAWRSGTGGWAADFGPPHTHSLYSGPEVDYQLARARKSTGLGERADREGAYGRDPAVVSSRRSAGAVTAASSAEENMARALDSTLQENEGLRLHSARSSAAIDSLLMRTSTGVPAAADSPAVSAALLRAARVDAALWEDSAYSVGSGTAGAGRGSGGREHQVDRDLPSGFPSSTEDGAEEPPQHARGGAAHFAGDRSPEGSDSGSSIDFAPHTTSSTHYNPYAADSSDAEDVYVEEEPSGDDVEFAHSLDDSMSLSQAVRG